MATTTRRTHIVRVPLDDSTGSSGNSMDVEVLDAIGFRGENGKEMVLSVAAADCAPFIVDETGGGHSKKPPKPTRRTHMERVKNGTSQLDIEVVDAVAFIDQNGQEWILDMSGSSSVFNTTTGVGDSSATRRTHNEKIYNPFGKRSNSFITIERCDTIAFRTIMGREVVIDIKSSDDQGSTSGRAATTVSSPKNYDPTKDDPKPPKNTDPHNYVKAVKGAKDFMTGKEPISMGPLWWIRKINVGGGIILITFEYTVSKDAPAQPTEPSATLTGLPFNPSKTYGVEDDIYQQITEGGNRIDIVNPVSDAMLAGLYQWSVVPPFVKKTNSEGSPNTLYYNTAGVIVDLTAEKAFERVPGGTDQCGNVVTYGSLVASFWNCNAPAWAEATRNGFGDINRLLQNNFNTREDAQYSADALNSLEVIKEGGIPVGVGSYDLTPDAGTTTVVNRAVLGFNLSALISQVSDPTATEFTFEINVPANPDGTMVVKGAAFAKIKDFPLDNENVPTVDGFPQDTLTKNAGHAGTITVTVDYEDKDNPVVSFTSNIEEPGGR